METGNRPAFYALNAGAWRDYVTILHLPYTAWPLSYVVIGAAVAPTIDWQRLAAALLAFFLALAIGAHALDERNGRPLRTEIPAKVLSLGAAIAITGAVAIGIAGSLLVTLWLLPFVIFGAFIVVAYNLELFGGRFHSDLWFALSWGAFPVLTGYWVNAQDFRPEAILVALACLALSLAQRTLSTQARRVRREITDVRGSIAFADGSTRPIDATILLAAPETALKLLTATIVLLAAGLIVAAQS